MSRMKDLLIDIQETIEAGKLSFPEIADLYGVAYADVMLAWEDLCAQYDNDPRSHPALGDSDRDRGIYDDSWADIEYNPGY